MTAAQRLLEVDAEDGAVRRLERGCARQARDPGGGRSARGLECEFRPAGPGDDRLGEISDRGAEVGVGEFATRVQLEVSANIGRADLALEAPAISRSLYQRGAKLAIRDDCGRGGVGELEAVDVEMGRGQTEVEVEAPQRRKREGLRAPPARRVDDRLRRSERSSTPAFRRDRAGDGQAPPPTSLIAIAPSICPLVSVASPR
jgi:hypothetical protein